MIKLKFDIIILSETWATNLEFYHNILPGYNLEYDVLVLLEALACLSIGVVCFVKCLNLN